MKRDDLIAEAQREPFRPFSIGLANGEVIFVEPGNILFPRARPERVVVFSADGLLHYFDIEAVVSVTVA